MATMRLTFSLTVEETAIDTEQIQPDSLELSVDGDNLRRAVRLPAGETVTLDAGEITPRWWYFQNVHASADLIISFGSSDDIILSPGEFSFLRSGTVPVARGSVAESKLLYAVYA